MTLSTTVNVKTYTGDNSTVAFSFPYLFYANSDLVATVNGVVKVLDTDYTVTGAENPAGGTVTFMTAPATSAAIVLKRIVDYTQETDLENFDGNPADVTEKQFDLIVMQTQQLAEQADRGIYAPTGTALTTNEISGTINATSKLLSLSTDGPQVNNIDADDLTNLISIEDDISTVADISVNVTTVAGISSNVTTVAGISSNVTTVAGIAANVTTVAGISANVTTVAGISADVTTVAGIAADVTAAANNIPKANRTAIVAPTVNDDSSEGYSEGSLWVDTVTNTVYFCADPADGAAVWVTTSLADGSVTEAKLADNAVTLAKMAPGTDGNLITYDANGDPAYVATGTAGQVLTSNGAGAAPTMQDAAAGGKLINRWVATYTGNAALTTAIPHDNTIPTSSEGTEIISTSVQQAAAGNILRFTFIGSAALTRTTGTGTEYSGSAALFTDLSSSAVQVGSCSSFLATNNAYNGIGTISFQHEMSMGDTSSHTVSVRAGADTLGSMRFNYYKATALFGGVQSAVLIIEEIEP